MPLLISAIALALTYLVLMQLMFEDFDDLRRRVRTFLEYLPISVVADYAFGRDSLRTWLWMMSGPVIAGVVYSMVAH
jgi:hypothetical protein